MSIPIINEDEEFDFSDNESEINSYIFNEKTLLNGLKKLSDEGESQLGQWRKYLDESEQAQHLIYTDNILDIPEQSLIEENCRELIDALPIQEEYRELALLNLQVIITIYCKSEDKLYKRKNGWVQLLGILILKGFSRFETYNLFKNMRDIYVPSVETHSNLLHLLLLYHDPELCIFFDQNNISIVKSTRRWTNTLFAGVCSVPVVNRIWDYMFNFEDPFFISFLCLAVIIEFSKEIRRSQSKSYQKKVEETIKNLPNSITEEEIVGFLRLAESLELRTPSSFKVKYHPSIFGKNRRQSIYSEELCLHVTAQEVMRNVFVTSPVDELKVFKFFVVDCRPLEQFETGHLPIGYFINCNSIFELDAPDYVNTLKQIQKLKDMVKSTEPLDAVPKHICLMGSGLVDNSECVEIIAKDLIQNYFPYVSIITGGYQSVHTYFGTNSNNYLLDHNERSCLVCLLNTPPQLPEKEISESMDTETNEPLNFSDRIKTNLTRRGREANKKLMQWIQTSSSQRKSLEGVQKPKRLSINDWLQKPGVLEASECKEITKNKTWKSWLIITDNDFILLRKIHPFKKEVDLIIKCSFSSIRKITENKRNFNLITFTIDKIKDSTDSFKLLIPDAKKIVELIQQKIS